jgi:putative aldouronate transport system substrate-binding protein
MYGAEPYKYRVQNGKVVSTFILPEYREATVLMKKLYDEGILDKEFATTVTKTFTEKWYMKGMLMQWNSGDRVIHNAKDEALGIESPTPESKNWKLMFAPPLTQFKTDEKYILPYKSYPITTHGVYISSSSKHPEEDFKVIEGFASEELMNAIYWGKEGETFTMKDGKKIPDAKKLADPKQSWGKMLYIVTGNRDADLVNALIEQATSAEYTKALYDSAKAVANMAEKKGYALSDFFRGASDNALKKKSEMQQYITQATIEAIMGKITLEEFDKRVQAFNGKYGFIYDEMTKFMNDNKDNLRKVGVKEVDW